MRGYHAKFTLLHEECLGNKDRFVLIILLIEACTSEVKGRESATSSKMLQDI
jgi:hypothetical protein